MKKLVSIFIVIFLFVFSVNAKEIRIEINKIGGKVINEGEHKGEIGFKTVKTIEEYKANGSYIFKADCSGKGNNPCPNRSIAIVSSNYPSPELYNTICTVVENGIDMGEIAGEFIHEEFLCTWENGKKEDEVIEEEGNEVGVPIPIYSYKLTIAWEDEIIITPELTISVFPNPVQNYLNVQFSMDIDAQMFVKIIDLEGNTRWEADMYIPGRDLQIDILESVVPTGVYFINCTNNDYTASTSFVKQ